jgi:excisionase family DNA binding protein
MTETEKIETENNTVMSAADVAKETHSSLRFIYKEMKKGNIPHIRLGDKYLIGRESFLKWVNSNSR